MSMNVSFLFLIHLSLKAGAKVQFFFNQTSFFEKIFFIPQNNPTTLTYQLYNPTISGV